MKNAYFTIIDKNYMLRAFVLYKSIKKYLEKDFFFIVCLDIESYGFLQTFKEESFKLILSDTIDKQLINKLKLDRKYDEFCWTMKSISFDYLFKKNKFNWILYLDSDSMVFSSLKKHLNDKYDLIIAPHNSVHTYFQSIEEKVGKYNAGFIAIRLNSNGKKILKFWKRKCLENCSNIPLKEIYGDQKYFNQIVKKFKKVNSSPFSGINLAPWNICDSSGKLNYDGKTKIVFYHMQGFKIYNKNIFQIYSSNFSVSNLTYITIYKPYINLVKNTFSEFEKKKIKFFQKNEFSITPRLLLKTLFFLNKNLKVI